MKFVLATAILAGASCMTGCSPGSQSSYVQLNAPLPTMKSRPATAVEIFSTPHVQHPYTEIGILGVQGINGIGVPSWDELILALRTQAGTMGCDALYLLGRVDNFIQGTCLAYTDSPHP